MAKIVEKEISKRAMESKPKTWMDAFSGEDGNPFLEREFPLEDRKNWKAREIEFEA